MFSLSSLPVRSTRPSDFPGQTKGVHVLRLYVAACLSRCIPSTPVHVRVPLDAREVEPTSDISSKATWAPFYHNILPASCIACDAKLPTNQV